MKRFLVPLFALLLLAVSFQSAYAGGCPTVGLAAYNNQQVFRQQVFLAPGYDPGLALGVGGCPPVGLGSYNPGLVRVNNGLVGYNPGFVGVNRVGFRRGFRGGFVAVGF